MKFSENKKVDAFLTDFISIKPDEFNIIESVRQIFLDANQNLVEDIKYGGIVFTLSDSLIGGIYVYKDHISIEFSNGFDLSDPKGILEGKGKKRRHLKITEKQDIKNKNIKSFIEEAVNP